ncbi:uncharacterized protein LOC135947834 [Cloeon dipterum]|uniref:uncharacterized protein LOC135947834 n=1 Tax=Cloeon dipterum TaxID=197152 RepID=UPI00321F8F90
MDPRRRNRHGRPAPAGNNYANANAPRPFVKMDRISMDRITQIPSPFHHSNSVPSPYSRRMPVRQGQMVGSPYQIFSPRHQQQQQGYHGLPPVPPYPFHNVDLTPRRRQGPVTRSALRPQNNLSRLTAKPALKLSVAKATEKQTMVSEKPKRESLRPQPANRRSLAPEKLTKPVEKLIEKPKRESLRPEPARRKSVAPEKQTKSIEKPKRESLRPEPARRRSVAPPVRSATDFIERNKMNAGRRKSVDPSALREMKAAPRRQSLARAAKTPRPEVTLEPVEINIEEPAQPEKVENVEQVEYDQFEAKENVPDNVLEEAPLPKKAKLDNSELEEEEKPKSPKQTTSLFLQYLDIKKDDLPNIVADYDSQAAADCEPTKGSKKNRCAIM